MCLSATSICGTAASSLAAADTTPPVITVLLNSLSVNATTSTGQLLVVTTVYVGEHARNAVVCLDQAHTSHSVLYSLPRTADRQPTKLMLIMHQSDSAVCMCGSRYA